MKQICAEEMTGLDMSEILHHDTDVGGIPHLDGGNATNESEAAAGKGIAVDAREARWMQTADWAPFVGVQLRGT